MAAFYHLISLGLTYMGSILVVQTIPSYEAPSFPVSIALAVASGPAEEILFFGLPYYLTANPYAVLVTGAIWSAAHIFGTHTFQLNTLGYVTFLATIPHLFFSLRTWISGKGWFAILFHVAWNLAFLLTYCAAGIRNCTVLGQDQHMETDLYAIAIAGSLIAILYLLHTREKTPKTKFKAAMVFSISALVIFEILINIRYFGISAF
jgi:membrane protease YdiL (CAAX protease family)